MKIVSLFCLLIISAGLFSQKMKTSTDSRDVVVNYPDSTLTFSILSKEKKINVRLDHVYYWYSANNVRKNLGGYSGKLLHGKYQVYDIRKNLITQGKFKYGLKNGEWKEWHSKGGLYKVEHWKSGVRNREFILIDANGNMVCRYYYKNNLQHRWNSMYQNGKESKTFYWKGQEVDPRMECLFYRIIHTGPVKKFTDKLKKMKTKKEKTPGEKEEGNKGNS